MSLYEHLLQKLLPLPGCAELGRSAAPSILNSSLSPSRVAAAGPCWDALGSGSEGLVFPHPWSLAERWVTPLHPRRVSRFISPAVHTGSTVSCHSRNIPQAPRCRCCLVHEEQAGVPRVGVGQSSTYETPGSDRPGSLPREETACGFVLDLDALGWMDGAPDPAGTGERLGCCPGRGESCPVITHLKRLQDTLATGSSRQMLTARIKGSRLGRPHSPCPKSPRPGWMEPASAVPISAASSAVMCLSAPLIH